MRTFKGREKDPERSHVNLSLSLSFYVPLLSSSLPFVRLLHFPIRILEVSPVVTVTPRSKSSTRCDFLNSYMTNGGERERSFERRVKRARERKKT